MEHQIPYFRYRCTKCANQYPMFINNGRCFCGGELFDRDSILQFDDGLWFKEAFDAFPCVLAHEYRRLYDLSKSNNHYGVFLQIRDVIESTAKFIVLSAIAWGKYKNVASREKYEMELANKSLSLGNWVNQLSTMVRTFYARNEIKNSANALPMPLWNLLDRLLPWCEKNKLVNWRNEKLGHGALGFADDPQFQDELREKIKAITDFYKKNAEQFSAIEVFSDETFLSGASMARDLQKTTGQCSLHVGNDRIDANPFIVHIDGGIFYFDEVIRSKNSRMLSYPLGKACIHYDSYTAHLAQVLKDSKSSHDAKVDYEFMTEADSDFLSKLGNDDMYVEPRHLTQWLKSCIDKHSKGVFFLEMDRGCGKSYFAEKLNRRFPNPEIIDEQLDVRTYHLVRTQGGGISDFLTSISYEWRRAFGCSTIVGDVRDLAQDKDNPENNAFQMAEFLKRWRSYSVTSTIRPRREKIMLVLDGLDEIGPNDNAVWSFLPVQELLEDGIYILLTGRSLNSNNISSKYRDHIAKLNIQEHIKVEAASPDNISLLREYITQRIPTLTDSDKERLLSLSDGKIINLSMLCSEILAEGIPDLSEKDMTGIVLSYLSMLYKRYSERSRQLLKMVLAVLCTFVEYETLSMQELAELTLAGGIKYELLDVISDISPVLSVERGFSDGGEFVPGENRYYLTNSDIVNAVQRFLGSENTGILETIQNAVIEEIGHYEGSVSSAGMLCYISHFHQIAVKNVLSINIDANLLRNIEKYAAGYNIVDEYSVGLVNQRKINALRQIISLAQSSEKAVLVEAEEPIQSSCYALADYLEDELLYEELVAVYEFLYKVMRLTKNHGEIELAEISLRLGDNYSKAGSPNAEHCYLDAIGRLYPLSRKEKVNNNRARILLAYSLCGLEKEYYNGHQYEKAQVRLNEAERLIIQLLPNVPELNELYISLLFNKAVIEISKGKASQAEKLYRQVYDKSRKQIEDEKDNDVRECYRVKLADVENEYAMLLKEKCDYERAAVMYAEAYSIYHDVSEHDIHYELRTAKVCLNWGSMCRETKEYDKAEQLDLEALAIYQKYQKISPAVYSQDVADISQNLGTLYMDAGRNDDALEIMLTALKLKMELCEENPMRFSESYADTCFNMGRFMRNVFGNLYESKRYYSLALELYEKINEINFPNECKYYRAACDNYAFTLQLMRTYSDPEAIAYIRKAFPDSPINFILYIHFNEHIEVLTCSDETMTEHNGWNPLMAQKVQKMRRGESKGVTSLISDEDATKMVRTEQLYRNEKDIDPLEVNESVLSKFCSRIKKIGIANKSEQTNTNNEEKEQYSPELLQIKSDFRTCMGFVRTHNVRSIVTIGSSQFQQAVAYKRNGQYIDANRLYCKMIRDKAELSTTVAIAWYKLLAVSGDIRDAVELADFVLNSGIEDSNTINLFVHVHRLILCVEGANNHSPIEYLRKISGNPLTYHLNEDDLDIPCRAGYFQDRIDTLKKNDWRAFREIRNHLP